jgi:hypothetical protein
MKILKYLHESFINLHTALLGEGVFRPAQTPFMVTPLKTMVTPLLNLTQKCFLPTQSAPENTFCIKI